MVISQSVGDENAQLIDSDEAKSEIQKIEHANQAIRDALLKKVGQNTTQMTEEEKREQALLDLRAENPLFADAIEIELNRLLPSE